MKSNNTKTLMKKKRTNEESIVVEGVLKFLKALRKVARAKANKRTRSNDLPSTVKVSVKYLRALRRAVGQLIDPETADVNWWHVDLIDPYGDHEYLPPQLQCTGREHFARAPGTDVWIACGDLPEATYKRLSEIHS
jgi:hypothetical protein